MSISEKVIHPFRSQSSVKRGSAAGEDDGDPTTADGAGRIARAHIGSQGSQKQWGGAPPKKSDRDAAKNQKPDRDVPQVIDVLYFVFANLQIF